MEKKKKLIILGVILLLIIVSGATFAILTWNSTMIKLGINTNCFTIDYTKGGDITGSLKLINWDDIYSEEDNTFTIKKGMGLSYVNVGINSNCSIEGYGTIYLNVTELSDTFKDGGESFGALRYAILKNTSNLSNSDITIDNLENQSFEMLMEDGIVETGKIELYSEQLSNTEVNKYIVIIYIDDEMSGNDVTEATFKGNISVEAEQKNITPDYCFYLSDKDEENKTASISDYYCYEGNSDGNKVITDVVIPSEIDGYTITSIYYNGTGCSRANTLCAFSRKKITSVIIPDSVATIETNAFIGNQLTNITIPDSVTTIGDYAFNNNPLTSILVDSNNPVYDSRDNSNAIIETSTNKLIQGSQSTIIPDSVVEIGYSAFNEVGLTDIIIPNSVTKIGGFAFYYNQLTDIDIPNSVTVIGWDAFENNQLTSVKLGNSVTTIESMAFSHNQLTSITIPDSVTTIKGNAFAYNNLNYVYIGNNSKLTAIDGGAFSSSNNTSTNSNTGITYVDNPNLKKIYYNGSNSLPWIYAVNDNYSEKNNKFATGTVPSYTDSLGAIYNEVLITTGK